MKYLLVGSQFCQGAPAVLAHGLAQRTPVVLRAEPDNAYDPLAVQVFVAKDNIRESEALAMALIGFGTSLEDTPEEVLLGHLGASRETKVAKVARSAGLTHGLTTDWHNRGSCATGRVTFEGCGVVTVECDERVRAEGEEK